MMKMEQWKDIKDYEGLYQISDEGIAKSYKWGKERILKTGKNNKGYLFVVLYKDGKRTQKLVHRLVAEAFIPNPNNYEQVNHKDENPSNNHVSNLEWCTPKYNINYGTGKQRSTEKRSKRVDQIDAVTGEIVRQWESTAECGRNGFNEGAVAACARGVKKQHKGFFWKYIS